jgi:hypothetical protein
VERAWWGVGWISYNCLETRGISWRQDSGVVYDKVEVSRKGRFRGMRVRPTHVNLNPLTPSTSPRSSPARHDISVETHRIFTKKAPDLSDKVVDGFAARHQDNLDFGLIRSAPATKVLEQPKRCQEVVFSPKSDERLGGYGNPETPADLMKHA